MFFYPVFIFGDHSNIITLNYNVFLGINRYWCTFPERKLWPHFLEPMIFFVCLKDVSEICVLVFLNSNIYFLSLVHPIMPMIFFSNMVKLLSLEKNFSPIWPNHSLKENWLNEGDWHLILHPFLIVCHIPIYTFKEMK